MSGRVPEAVAESLRDERRCPVAPNGRDLPWHVHDDWYTEARSSNRAMREALERIAALEPSGFAETVFVTPGIHNAASIARATLASLSPLAEDGPR